MLSLCVAFLAALTVAKLVPCSDGVDGVSKCFCVSKFSKSCDAASAIQFMSSVENFGTYFQDKPSGPHGPGLQSVFTATSATAGSVTSQSSPEGNGQLGFGCGIVGGYNSAIKESLASRKRGPGGFIVSENIVGGVQGSATFDYSPEAFSFNFACAPFEEAFLSAWTIQGYSGFTDVTPSYDGMCCIPDDDDDDDGSEKSGANKQSDDSEIGDTGAPGDAGLQGASGPVGAVGYTGAPGPAGPAGVLEICSVALTNGNTATITIDEFGSCSVTSSGTKKRDVKDDTGVVARVGVSLVYKRTGGHRHHDESSGKSSSSSDIEEQRCGPQVSLLIDGQRVYKNSAVVFDAVGVINGFVELALGTGPHTFELDVSAHHCGDRRLVIENELIELTVVETGVGGVVSGSVQVPTLLQK